VTFNVKFTSAVFHGHTLEARLLLAMSRVLDQVDEGRARQYAGLARELAVMSGRLGHADSELISGEPELAAAATSGAILHRTEPFRRDGANRSFSFEVRRRRVGFVVVLAERESTESARELGQEISAVEQGVYPEYRLASAAVDALLKEHLQRERESEPARREATVVAMHASYALMGVVAAHEPPLEVAPICGEETMAGVQAPVAAVGLRAA